MRTAPQLYAKNPVLLMVGEGGGGVADYKREGAPHPQYSPGFCSTASPPEAEELARALPGRGKGENGLGGHGHIPASRFPTIMQ
jgi:hypothetical protein